jgi:hypothetical protein
MLDLKIDLLPMYTIDKKDNKFFICGYCQVLVPDTSNYTKKEIEELEE